MTLISARLQAIEDSLRDQSDDESFNYDAFIRQRNSENVAEQIALPEIKDKLQELAKEVEKQAGIEPSQRQRNVIDSDSEDEDEDEPENENEGPEDESHLAAESEPEASEEPQLDELMEQDQETRKQRSKPSRPRKSRDQAEQELARMKRQLDVEIEVYSKPKPSVSEFIANFNKKKQEHKMQRQLHQLQQDDSDLEIVSDSETPRGATIHVPVLKPDRRAKLFHGLFKSQKQQQEKRRQENMERFKALVGEDELDEQDEEEIKIAEEQEIMEKNLEPTEVAPSLPTPDHTSPPAEEVSLASSPTATPEDESDAEATQMNETQVEAPVDPKILKQMYRRQQKIFNDSDTEDSDSELVSLASDDDMPAIPVTSSIDREELEKLTPSQQSAELRRRFQLKSEMALEMLEQQAQESDEDETNLNTGDTDDDDDDGPPVENLIDDTNQVLQEDELHAKFVDAEREMDEYVTNLIRRDVVNGAWRSKHLYDKTGMLQDSDDEDAPVKRFKRLDRQRVLENSRMGRLAENPKTKAFAEFMVESYMHSDHKEQVFENVEDCLSSLNGVSFTAPVDTEEVPSQIPVMMPMPQVATCYKSNSGSFSGTRAVQRDSSVLSRALPTTHTVPVLANKHVKQRKKMVAPKPKALKLSCKSIGLGYKPAW